MFGAPSEPKLKMEGPSASANRDQVKVQGVGNLLTHMAGCCKAVPGDAIAGFITQGRGVSIHRSDCGRLIHLLDISPERVIEVSWGASPEDSYQVEIAIEAYDRQGLLRDVTEMLANARINVLGIQTQSNRKSHTATMRLTVEVQNLGSLSRLLERLNRLKNISSAVRLSE